MRKNFGMRARRVRRDMLMISISAFALIGGLYVFQSFAASRYDTTKPGVVPYSALTPALNGNSTILQLSTSSGLQYCFTQNGFVMTSNGQKTTLLYNDTNERFCFVPTSSNAVSAHLNGRYGDADNLEIISASNQ